MPVGIDPALPQDINESSAPSITANVNQQAGETNRDVSNTYNAGTSTARGLLNSPSNFNQGLSYGDSATTAAIKSRYQQQATVAQNQLSIDTMKQASSDHLRNLQTATAAAGQEVEQNRQKALLKWNIDQANKKARGAILGTTLGIIGGVVGGIYSGGAGAAAGYAAGSGVGNAVGSSN